MPTHQDPWKGVVPPTQAGGIPGTDAPTSFSSVGTTWPYSPVFQASGPHTQLPIGQFMVPLVP